MGNLSGAGGWTMSVRSLPDVACAHARTTPPGS
jgi:hypothetical protein